MDQGPAIDSGHFYIADKQIERVGISVFESIEEFSSGRKCAQLIAGGREILFQQDPHGRAVFDQRKANLLIFFLAMIVDG